MKQSTTHRQIHGIGLANKADKQENQDTAAALIAQRNYGID